MIFYIASSPSPGVLNSVMSLLLGFGSVNSVVLEPVVNLVISVLTRLSVSTTIHDFHCIILIRSPVASKVALNYVCVQFRIERR